MAGIPTSTTSGIPIPSLLPSDAPHNPYPTKLPPYIGAVFMETFLYGIYCILFGICTYVLLRRNKALHWILLVFAILMFSLATTDIVYTYYIFFTYLLNGTLTFRGLYPKYVMFVTNNVLADSLLMYRCFVVWGYKKWVIVGPILLLIAGTVCGYLFEGASASLFKDSWVYLSMTFALNIILTGLTAGRIWYLARKGKTVIGPVVLQRYNATIAILVESGVLYSTYIILDLAFQNHSTANAILDAGLIQVVGIMPTLIIVQVGLGRAVQDLETDDALARIEANKRASHSTSDGMRSYHDARSFREAIRSQRSLSDATANVDMNGSVSPTAPSVRSTRSHNRSFYDPSASRRTLYDFGSDIYTAPSPSPRSLPPSPVVAKPEASRLFLDGKAYQSFPEAVTLVNSRDSYFSNDAYPSAI